MELHSAEPKAQELGHGLTGGVKELGHDVAGLLKKEPKEEEAKDEEPKEELTSVKKVEIHTHYNHHFPFSS